MNKQVIIPANEEDRISKLPDDIISKILSSLYVEESARTSILSKRWHKMWLISPITISDESIVKQSRMSRLSTSESSSWIISAMSHIICTHPGPIHTCHFMLPIWYGFCEIQVFLLRILTLKGIRNIRINDCAFKFPSFVLECDSLVNVHLYGGSIPTQLPTYAGIFPNLRKLTLKYFDDTHNEFLVNLLSSRSIIELTLDHCDGLKDIVIESNSLQKLNFDNRYGLVINLIIKDVPNLESVKLDCSLGRTEVAILNAPKLKVLSHFNMKKSMLQLGSYRFYFNYRHKRIKISGEITYMPSLRSLDILLGFDGAYEVKSVSQFLLCFPCLETLEVKDGSSTFSRNDAAAVVVDDDYADYVPLMSSIKCLNHHLKRVKLYSSYGSRANLNFARLIIATAKVLEH